MTDVRTMRSYLDLLDERDEALAEATRLADLLALSYRVTGALLCGLTDPARTAESGPLAAERRDPTESDHPEHPTPQEAAQ